MKKLFLILVLGLSACNKGGGTSSPPVVPPDTTPHDYVATFYALTNTMVAHPATLHQVCNFGLAGARDESVDFVLMDPGTSGGIGCGAASNYTLTASNTGTDILYLVISIDGVARPQEVVQPGAAYSFQRGF